MSDPTNPLAWVGRAEEDFAVLNLSLASDPQYTYSACFHAQQCAEKYLKALLVAHQHPFPKTHDLRQLANLCVQAGVALDLDLDQVDQLTFYASRVRYPGEDPTDEEAEEARSITSDVRVAVRLLLGVT